MNFHGLRTFVAKLCRRDLRTFSAKFWGWNIGTAKSSAFRMYVMMCNGDSGTTLGPLWNYSGILSFTLCLAVMLIISTFSIIRKPKEIVTLEYGNFKSEHPAWSFIRWGSLQHTWYLSLFVRQGILRKALINFLIFCHKLLNWENLKNRGSFFF